MRDGCRVLRLQQDASSVRRFLLCTSTRRGEAELARRLSGSYVGRGQKLFCSGRLDCHGEGVLVTLSPTNIFPLLHALSRSHIQRDARELRAAPRWRFIIVSRWRERSSFRLCVEWCHSHSSRARETRISAEHTSLEMRERGRERERDRGRMSRACLEDGRARSARSNRFDNEYVWRVEIFERARHKSDGLRLFLSLTAEMCALGSPGATHEEDAGGEDVMIM